MKSLKKSKRVKKVQNKFAFYKCFVHVDINKRAGKFCQKSKCSCDL